MHRQVVHRGCGPSEEKSPACPDSVFSDTDGGTGRLIQSDWPKLCTSYCCHI